MGEVQTTSIPDTEVVCRYEDSAYNNVVEVLCVDNGKVVARFGTENYEDYYPCFVAQWMPENLPCNEKDAILKDE